MALCQADRPMLAEMSLIAVQTEAEASASVSWAPPAACEVTGSIKFDLTIDPQLLPRAGSCASNGARRSAVWIAASTRRRRCGGAAASASVLQCAAMPADPGAAPPERFNAVHALCAERFATVRRLAQPSRANRVLLGDTMGELLFLYAWPTSPSSVAAWCRPVGTTLEPAALAAAGAHGAACVQLPRNQRDAA
jgi:3-deoxy-D-manno-octulosonic-acid transferase